jgi:hypothetical protein
MGCLFEDPVEEQLPVVLVLVLNGVVWGSLLHAILEIKVNLGMGHQQLYRLDGALLTGDHEIALLI